MIKNLVRLRFTVPEGTDVPSPGDTVSAAIGGDWFEIGVFDEAKFSRTTGEVTLWLLLNDAFTDVELVDP